MPIIDKKRGEQEFRVAKRGLDPFGAEEQALNLVKRNRAAPVWPNATKVEYDVEDHGDYYKILVKGKQPQGKGRTRARDVIGQGRDKSNQGRGKSTDKSTPGLDVAENMLSADGPAKKAGTGTYDLTGRLGSLYTVPELRDEARRAGVYVSQNMRKHEIINALADEAPLRARRLIGR